MMMFFICFNLDVWRHFISFHFGGPEFLFVFDAHRDAALENYQISAPQYLEKNKVYYIEVLFKQGVGFDRMIVGMRTPGGETKVPIGNQDLMLNITEECEYQCLNHHENVLFQKKNK